MGKGGDKFYLNGLGWARKSEREKKGRRGKKKDDK